MYPYYLLVTHYANGDSMYEFNKRFVSTRDVRVFGFGIFRNGERTKLPHCRIPARMVKK
jgi:hypothetical protein